MIDKTIRLTMPSTLWTF